MIEFQHASREFDGFLAVDDVSFRVEPGEVVGLLGPNGAGKTTALRMLATLLKPTRGHVLVDSIDTAVNPLQVRQRIGYQTGDTGLYDRLTPREFLLYFGRFHEIEKAELARRVNQVIAELQIGEFESRPCGKLSTGQRQRVTLARTLLHEPAALVLDEPTNGLDIVSSSFIVSMIRRAADQGKAVLLSTHIMGEVELTCDRLVIIHRGRIIAAGPRDELVRSTGQNTLSHAFLHLIETAEAQSQTGDHPTPERTP